jgi:DNA polymerase-3 subunit gamma/tau
MSYQVLARKYRPKSFDTLVGQEHVVRALTHALDQQRLHHAYLFTGTRGVGKTTLSRILAKSFNCEKGITSTPCGVCDACTSIDAGRFVDYIEMDAASNRGVDEMAQLLEQAVYAPSNARFKVYMIDEVHMLTNHAFNAMLKTLEEPPEHIKFILATTDPQKIPVTVLSRCLQFNLKQMPPGHIVSHLDNILGQEHIEFETPALRLLAQGAHGSMRDALSLTDQAIAYAAGKVTLEAVQGMLGALDQSFLIRLLDALAQKDGVGLLAVADDMAARSLSYNAALQDLGTLLHRIALAQSVSAAIADDTPEREHILRLARLFSAEEVQLFYQIAVHGRNELGLAPDEHAGFSMTLLRMLAFRPEMGGAQTRAQPVATPAAANPGRAAAPAAAPSVAPAAPPRAAAAAAVAPAVSSAPVPRPAPVSGTPMSPAMAALAAARGGLKKSPAARPAATEAVTAAPAAAPSPAPAPAPQAVAVPLTNVFYTAAPAAQALYVAEPEYDMPAGAAPTASQPMHDVGPDDIDLAPAPPWDMDEQPRQKKTESAFVARSSPTPSAAPAVYAAPVVERSAELAAVEAPALVPVPTLNWDGNWPVLAAALAVRGVAQQLALQSEMLSCLAFGDGVQMHLRVPMDTLLSAGSLDKLTLALNEHFGKAVRIITEIGPVRHTAHAAANADRAQRQREAEQNMHSDPFVQTLMREFGATIVPGSIRPN